MRTTTFALALALVLSAAFASCDKDEAVAPTLTNEWRLVSEETSSERRVDGGSVVTTERFVGGAVTLSLQPGGSMRREGSATIEVATSAPDGDVSVATVVREIRESGTYEVDDADRLVLKDDLERYANGLYFAPAYEYALDDASLEIEISYNLTSRDQAGPTAVTRRARFERE